MDPLEELTTFAAERVSLFTTNYVLFQLFGNAVNDDESEIESDEDEPISELQTKPSKWSLDTLPFEVLLNILKHLPWTILLRVHDTCHRLEYVTFDSSLWKSIDCEPMATSKPNTMLVNRLFSNVLPTVGPFVRTLHLGIFHMYLRKYALENVLAKLYRLSSFTLTSAVKMTSEELMLLCDCCQQLQELRIPNCKVLDDDILSYIGTHLNRLKKVDISAVQGFNHITDAGLVGFVHHTHDLDTLVVTGCHSLTDKALQAIASCCPQLTRLEAAGCFATTTVGFQSIFLNCQFLELLDLSFCWQVDDTLFLIKKNTGETIGGKLRYLSVQGCNNITDVGIARMCSNMELKMLDCLNISYCMNITKAAYECLKRDVIDRYHTLKRIFVEECRFKLED